MKTIAYAARLATSYTLELGYNGWDKEPRLSLRRFNAAAGSIRDVMELVDRREAEALIADRDNIIKELEEKLRCDV